MYVAFVIDYFIRDHDASNSSDDRPVKVTLKMAKTS